jgi:hypothetical protein
LSCDNNNKGEESYISNGSNIKFRINSPLIDSLSAKEKYFNSITFYSRLDSIREIEGLSESEIKSSIFLFVYRFDPDEDVPKEIEEFNEDESDIFIPENSKTIAFDYSFNKKGANNLVLIFLENISYTTKSGDSIRIIDNYGIKRSSIFVNN